MLEVQNQILEMVARGDDLEVVARRLCGEIERFAPGIISSILTINADGTVHTVAAPKLHRDFIAGIEGLPIGPANGACGTAAYLGEPVTILDMANDPRWGTRFPQPTGIEACWSSPIRDVRGQVVGTFAFYYGETRGPTEGERRLVETCVHLCSIAIEHDRWRREHLRLAYTDVLTGLPNLLAFNAELSRPELSEPADWGLFIVDLANLKAVNDALGHYSGDALVQIVAARLAGLGEPGRTFRIDGNTFAVLLASPVEVRDLDDTATRYLRELRLPAECDGHTVTPRATIGCARSSDSGFLPEQVRKNARFALHHAKNTSRAGFVQYDPAIGTRMAARLEAIRTVNAALREDRITAFYQPIVRLATLEVVGFEALARMRSGGGFIFADSFHSATTDAHIAADLTACMLDEVSAAAGGWLRQGLDFDHVAINVSSSDFYGGRLIEQIVTAFSREQVPLDRVVIEITESVYLDPGDVTAGEIVRKMQGAGLRVALDDFGTGYASLHQLLTVPVDFVKLDRSFVGNIATRAANRIIVEGLLRIASGLGVDVIGEGIENEEQLTLLRTGYCNLGQGYLFSPAVPYEAATGMLRARSCASKVSLPEPPWNIGIGEQPWVRQGTAQAAMQH